MCEPCHYVAKGKLDLMFIRLGADILSPEARISLSRDFLPEFGRACRSRFKHLHLCDHKVSRTHPQPLRSPENLSQSSAGIMASNASETKIQYVILNALRLAILTSPQRTPSKTALRTDRVRAFPPGDSRVYVWSAVPTPDCRTQPHTGPHLLPKQPQTACPSEGLR